MPPKKTATKPEEKPNGLGLVTDISKLKTETLVGDVRDLLLQEYRDAKEGLAWTLRGERSQQEVIDRIDGFSRDLVARCVTLIAGRGEKSLPCQVIWWKVKDGIQMQINIAANSENISMLSEQGTFGHLVLADPAAFSGERASIKPQPDQRRMFDEDSNPGEPPTRRNKRKDIDGDEAGEG